MTLVSEPTCRPRPKPLRTYANTNSGYGPPQDMIT